MAFAFEKLKVYQKAVDLADHTSIFTSRFSRGFYYLADRLNRVTLAIAAHIAVGNGQFTKSEKKTAYGQARGSICECVPLLEVAKRRALITADQHERLFAELEDISKMLSGLIKGLDKAK
jgi:four helix bundle protein